MKMLFVLLFGIGLLGALIQAQDNPDSGFISIDCGAPNAYMDDTLLIQYETDEGFIDSGQNMQVASNYFNTIHRLTTLRSFPNGARNCYTLRPKQGNSNKYLIRASFYYGNYDGRSQTPEFELHIDVNYWTTITSNSTYAEIIYTTSRDYIHVCLVNIGSGIPFISVLELRILDNSTYNTTSEALETALRLNIGSLTTYRYPQDIYDRIWQAFLTIRWTPITNTTNVDSLKGNNNTYRVPTEVLMTAQQPKNSSYRMGLLWISPKSSYKWSVYLHFAEIQILPAGELRQLEVYVNDNTLVANVTPQFLKPVTVSTLPLDGTNLTISVISQSKFPPFFNVFEIFRVINLPNSPTNLDNLNAIIDIQSRYGVFGDVWQGDPCVPQEFTWKGLTCNQDDSPKITSLNMSSGGLKGTIAASFSNLSALESLDMSFNELTGPLPEFLANLPNLRVLNLSNNNLNGTIPEALIKKNSTDRTFILRLDGNPNLFLNWTTAAPSPSEIGGDRKKHAILPVASAVASAILVSILIKWD